MNGFRIQEYIELNNKEYERYNSWNHCYHAFENETDEIILSLHLGFYLASWGMYRGSSKLLQKDYLVHVDAIRIIKKYWYLRGNSSKEINENSLNDIHLLINELSSYYKGKHNVTATDTLISKIILGTLGCLPAFDRYFIDGVKEENLNFKTLTKKSLKALFSYVKNNKKLELISKKYPQYPKMKIIDMYFWSIGSDLDKK